MDFVHPRGLRLGFQRPPQRVLQQVGPLHPGRQRSARGALRRAEESLAAPGSAALNGSNFWNIFWQSVIPECRTIRRTKRNQEGISPSSKLGPCHSFHGVWNPRGNPTRWGRDTLPSRGTFQPFFPGILLARKPSKPQGNSNRFLKRMGNQPLQKWAPTVPAIPGIFLVGYSLEWLVPKKSKDCLLAKRSSRKVSSPGTREVRIYSQLYTKENAVASIQWCTHEPPSVSLMSYHRLAPLRAKAPPAACGRQRTRPRRTWGLKGRAVSRTNPALKSALDSSKE